MDSFANSQGLPIIYRLIEVVQSNKGYLSEVDGVIGDGDHGINMSKGFTLCHDRLADANDFSRGLKTLGRTLLMEIGGSMGPLYGTFFLEMAKVCNGVECIDKAVFGRMLDAALSGVLSIGNAKVGDKTMVDVLAPAVADYQAAVQQGSDFTTALVQMRESALKGRDSTIDLVAKIGRASRLGERSRGVLDAGATSCHLVLDSMAGSIISLLKTS